jgi:hypothetical protein
MADSVKNGAGFVWLALKDTGTFRSKDVDHFKIDRFYQL